MSLENIPEFVNNDLLKKLNAELSELEAKYYQMTAVHDTLQHEPGFVLQYNAIRDRIQVLKGKIEDLQYNILMVSLNMYRDAAHGSISPRQKEAYRLYEQGKSTQAISVLNSSEIMGDFKRSEALYTNFIQEAAGKCIQEQRMAIKILEQQMLWHDLNTFREIKRRYQEIIPVALKYIVEVSIVYDYILLLDNIDSDYLNISIDEQTAQAEEMISLSRTLLGIYLAHPGLCTLYSIYDLCNIIADSYPENSLESDRYRIKAVESVAAFLERFEDKGSLNYGRNCMLAGELLGEYEDVSAALYREALSVLEALAPTAQILKWIEICKNALQ